MMIDSFQHFMDRIPSNIRSEVKITKNSNVMVCRPKCYIVDTVMESEDYNFMFPTSTPPPSIIDKREYQFHKGSLVSFSPGVSVFNRLSLPTNEYISMSIKKKFFQDIAEEVTGHKEINFIKWESPNSHQLIRLIQQYESEMLFYDGSCPLMLQSIEVQMVIQLLRDTANNSGLSIAKPGKADNHINKALDYMHTYYNAGISIDDICREINLSPYYFIRLFKTQTGRTPHEHLLAMRIDKASSLLQENSYSVEEVARICGFVNTGHFSALFKKKMGMTPREYCQRN